MLTEPIAAPSGTCPSCWHPWSMHKQEGCWFTVRHGKKGQNMVCACSQAFLHRTSGKAG